MALTWTQVTSNLILDDFSGFEGMSVILVGAGGKGADAYSNFIAGGGGAGAYIEVIIPTYVYDYNNRTLSLVRLQFSYEADGSNTVHAKYSNNSVYVFTAGNGSSSNSTSTDGGVGGIYNIPDDLPDFLTVYMACNGPDGGDGGSNGSSNGYTSSGSGSNCYGNGLAGTPPTGTLPTGVVSQGAGAQGIATGYGSGGGACPSGYNADMLDRTVGAIFYQLISSQV